MSENNDGPNPPLNTYSSFAFAMPRVDGDPVVKAANREFPEGLVDEAGSG